MRRFALMTPLLALALPAPAFAEDSPASSGQAPQPKAPMSTSQPPRFERLPPYRSRGKSIDSEVGKPLRLLVNARHPTGLAISYSAKGLPEGARFDPVTQTFTWTPVSGDEGSHAVLFEATTGQRSDTLALTIQVGTNAPPLELKHEIFGRDGSPISKSLATTDPDGDAITYSSGDLPPGSQLDPKTGLFQWPSPLAEPKPFSFHVTASDGRAATTMPVEVYIKPFPPPLQSPRHKSDNEWESFLQPGLGYAYFSPGARDDLGAMSGIQFELNFISWIHRNDNRGPSHGRLYAKAEILRSSREGVSDLFLYSLGLTLSLERNPKRTWLIPHYGVELGGLTHPDLGGAFQTTAFGGVHLWASRNLFVNLTAGYLIVPENMKELAGFRTGASAEFSLW